MQKIKAKYSPFLLFVILFVCCFNSKTAYKNNDISVYYINKTEDFTVNGEGDNSKWEDAEWITLTKRKHHENIPIKTMVKGLYSESGVYFLFYCEDKLITSTMTSDFSDLWNEDVVEVFLWPDEDYPFYFEYELSPLNYELPILIANIDDNLLRWQPFHYEEDRQTRRKTSVIGGEKLSGATIEAWIAEFFVPYKLLFPLNNVPPKRGDKWRANFYRLDYDQSESISWLWQLTETNFHDYESFGTIIFN